MLTFELNRIYNFSLYPLSILGSGYTNARLKAILDYNTAIKFENIEHLQRQIFPYLPPGTPSTHNNYIYYLFEVDGKTVVIANFWIIPTSIELVNTVSRTITINNISDNQLAVIRDQLRLLGLEFTIS